MAKLLILDGTGHTTLPITPETRAEAEATFKRFLAQGGRAFAMEAGKPGTPIKNFRDAEKAEETILVPQLIGG